MIYVSYPTFQTGMINLMNQALFIHPLPSHLAQDYGSASGVQPHLIYKRSLKDVLGQPCNIDTEGTCRRTVQCWVLYSLR